MGQALGQGSKRLVVVCGIGSRRRGEKGKTNRVNRLRGGMGREPDPTRGGTAEVTGGGGRRGGGHFLAYCKGIREPLVRGRE